MRNTLVDPELLVHIPLFALMDKQELSLLAENLDYKKCIAGQTIFSLGDPGNTMYIVRSGEVELFLRDEDGERVTLEFVQPGQIFGELSLLDDEPRSASAVAVRNTEMYVVDRHDLQMLVKAHPHAALDMLTMLGKRIREANQLVRHRTAKNVNEVVEQKPLSWGERLSDTLTAMSGSIKFVYASLAWFLIWIIINSGIIPGIAAFDPYPFSFLTMVVSLEAIFLSLFVLISQNRQAERDRIRNDIEYDVNLKAEVEIRGLMKQVEDLQRLVIQHLANDDEDNLANTAE
ncbi:MAG: DUF1003 domain-containing protein [Anaerolineae bacterium]|nr:DUF1003 domain-containing protein [Anaerolineae bacterium]